MEVASITYRAKDGKLFLDPLECEEYEKTIGILPGSVGALIQDLEKLEPSDYIFGQVLAKGEERQIVYCRATVCCDSVLEDYVNVNNLNEQQRYLISTVGNFIEELRKTNKDYPCQYMLMYSSNIEMRNCGIMASYNKKAWKEQNNK